MAEDSTHADVVMLSNPPPEAPSQAVQTWAWNGMTWRQLSTVSTPTPHDTLADDPAVGGLVLIGHFDCHPGPEPCGGDADTWTFDGTNWVRHPGSSANPPARTGGAMAYDAATRNVLLIGGTDFQNFFNFTWSWNGVTWSRVRPASSPWSRQRESLAFDAADREVVLYGGEVGSEGGGINYYDTWTWDGSDWTLRQSTAQPASPAEAADMVSAAMTGASARLHAPYQPSGCLAGVSCLSTGSPLMATIGVDAGYVEYGMQAAQGPGGRCLAYVKHLGSNQPWAFVNTACADGEGWYPEVGMQDHVYVSGSGCANVYDVPAIGHVLTCLATGTAITIDDGPFLFQHTLWWHIKGEGFMAHDFLMAG
jgi:hypothetical protein